MSSPEQRFDDLQTLLGCKRYEQPPPGYFLSFSDRVIARIETEESLRATSWWDWLSARFDAKPVLVCAYGLAVSSLLFMGFRLSQLFDAEMAATPTVNGPWMALNPNASFLGQDLNGAAAAQATTSLFSSSRFAFHEEAAPLIFTGGARFEPAGFPAMH